MPEIPSYCQGECTDVGQCTQDPACGAPDPERDQDTVADAILATLEEPAFRHFDAHPFDGFKISAAEIVIDEVAYEITVDEEYGEVRWVSSGASHVLRYMRNPTTGKYNCCQLAFDGGDVEWWQYGT